MYYDYNVTLVKDGKRYVGFMSGLNKKDAIEHDNFWLSDADKIESKTGYKVVSMKRCGKGYQQYPFCFEDAIRIAHADRGEAVRKIVEATKDDDFDNRDTLFLEDFRTMISAVYSAPYALPHFDTMVRERFISIILGADYYEKMSGGPTADDMD